MELTLKRLLEQAKFTTYKGKGYESAEVDAFLDRAAAMAGKVEVQLTQAMDKAARAGESSGPDPAAIENEIERRVAERMAQRGAAGPGEEEAAEEARRTLLLAQRTADAAIRDARSDAEKLVGDAQERSQAVVAEAEAHARNIRSDNEAALARERNEARQQVAEEITRLEGIRESLHADVDTLETHLKAQRKNLGSSLSELQRLLDDPAGFRLDPIPALVNPDVPDLSPDPVPASSRFEAPSSTPAPRSPDPQTGSGSGGPGPAAQDEGEASSPARSSDAPAPSSRGASTPSEGPRMKESSPGGRQGTSTLTANPPTDRPSASTPTSASASASASTSAPSPAPSLSFDDVDHEAPGLDSSAPPGPEAAAPAATVDLREDASPSTSPDSGDNAFLAELRKAMADDEPLGPRDGDGDDDDDDDRRGWFGRRR